MRDETKIDWHQKIEKAISQIMVSLDSENDLERIAAESYSSPYHFHRKFRELTGESVHKCIMRLRIEKASFKLRNTYERITDIALDCGYETPEAFSKAFKSFYGLKPSDVRAFINWNGLLYSKAGIHYREKGKSLWFYIKSKGEKTMETKIINLPEKRIVCEENIGNYWGLPMAWERFHKTLGQNSLHSLGREWMSVFPDHDDSIPMDKKRSYAAMIVDKDFVNGCGLKEFTIPEGTYAIAVHFGSTEDIGSAWDKWLKEWLPDSGWGLDYSRPNLEWYQNRCTDPELTLTFMCTAVKKV